MYLVTLVVCCCSGDSGFDGTVHFVLLIAVELDLNITFFLFFRHQVMGGINSMHQYQEYFGMTGVGSKTSIVFGIFTVYEIYLVSKYSS